VRTLARHRLERDDGRQLFLYGSRPGPHLDSTAASSDPNASRPDIHRRLDPFTDEWVSFAPHRNARPNETSGPHEEACPVCPGGIELPFQYELAVFENRFPSLGAPAVSSPAADESRAPALGRCEVIVYTPRHETSFDALDTVELCRLLAVWGDRSRELWADERHEFVLLFENRGPEAGATLAHPHGQAYAFDHLPPIARLKVAAHRRHRYRRGECLGCAAIDRDSARSVCESDSFCVAVPFAPRWPYEVAVRVRRHGVQRLTDLTIEEQVGLLRALRETVLRYEALLGKGAPYLMTIQEAPRKVPDWHLAVEFYPLRRSATATKIRASVETATGLVLNDVVPELAAELLASVDVSVPPIDTDSLVTIDREDST
jgi:UDPglucose--hexose-1-phosphate uridylyltransferase